MPIAADDDVGGVNVAVDDGAAVRVELRVGVGEGVEQLVSDEHGCAQVEVDGLLAQSGRDALDGEHALEGEDEDVPAVDVEKVEGREDGGMVKASEDGGFSGEGITVELIGGGTAKGAESSEVRGTFAHGEQFAREASRAQGFERSVAWHPIDGVGA